MRIGLMIIIQLLLLMPGFSQEKSINDFASLFNTGVKVISVDKSEISVIGYAKSPFGKPDYIVLSDLGGKDDC
jgi:hypothetical protein